ncbi:MAG: LapA family protein [Pseudolabrys sp.]
MFRKIITAIIIVPLAMVLVAFAVANRQMVTLSFDPFSSASPAYAATLPLFLIILAVLILGVLIGGFAAWIRQGKWRRNARRLEGEVRALHVELDRKSAQDAYRGHPLSPDAPRLPVIPPPIP